MPRYSIIIPARNEARDLAELLSSLIEAHPEAEIIVVDDGSQDNTAGIAESLGAWVIRHPYGKGNGAAVKSGARAATGEWLIFLDADGQHPPEIITALLEQMNSGYDMVVGARESDTHASWSRKLANTVYNKLASWITERRIEDLTSGFRAVRAEKFREFLYLLPNGFSYPTTVTMAFFRAGYSVGYVPFRARQRSGNSHIQPLRDSLRFMLIIFKIGTLYSPLKIFFPAALLQTFIAISYYLYTYLSEGRLTNMVVILLVAATGTFLVGLLSEQITTLLYKNTE